jgi:ubiquinone/menaquinone biosynthesis C-methylase UbiE
LVAASFMFHELPQAPSDAILREMYRLTVPGGVVAITDNNPRSPVIQGLPPALFTLMKSTEPWSDEYYTYDLEAALTQVNGGCGWWATIDCAMAHA